MKATVTGATGFLGGYLVRSLAEEGFEITALARRPADAAPGLRERARLVEGDLSSKESIEEAVADADIVFHCAAITTNRTSWQAQHETNVGGTERMLEMSVKAGVGRFVHISSVLVYGLNPPRGDGAVTEASPHVENPERWAYYVRSKAAADKLALSFSQKERLPVTVIRLGILYGPGDGVPGQQPLAQLGPVRVLLGSGRNLLPFTYVENAVDCILLAARAEIAAGQVYNVVDEPQISGRKALSKRAKLTGRRPMLVRVPASLMLAAGTLVELSSRLRTSDTPPPLTRHLIRAACRDIRYDSSKARQQLGWQQRFSLEEGLRRTLGMDGP